MSPLIPKRNKVPKSGTDPARLTTGTSYKAQGHVQPETADYSELGSQFKSPIPDPVSELSSLATAQRTYKKMFRTDVSVRVGLRCGEAPVLGAEYDVIPFDETEAAKVQADFLRANLFSTPWLSTLSQILKMYRDGFQVFEPVWELREWAPAKSQAGANRRQYTMLRKLAVRPVDTLSDFVYDDNGGLSQLTQNAIGTDFKTREVKIPISKLLIFTFEKDGGDIRGESILRTAYPHWYYKQKLYAIDAIQKERHGIGVPVVELQPGYDKKKDVPAANQLARNLRTNENAYIVTDTFKKIYFAELKGQTVDALASAEHHDNMIMKNILVQFLNLGMSGGGGGRATGATSFDMMLKAMRYVANYICDQFNYYLVPQIIGYNFQTDQFPQLICRNIGETKDMQMWAAAMANLVNAEAISVDDETENWIRRQVDVPPRTTPRPVPFEGPHDIKTLIQEGGNKNGTTSNGNGNSSKGAGGTKQVQTGNVGKSPSSGAV